MRLPGRWAGAEGRLLCLLEDNVELCLNLLASRASADSAFAPSFAEMGEAIDCMVLRTTEAGVGAEAGDDEALPLTLSPAHQLVLNCIWLNLKASCALACDLAEVDWPGLAEAEAEVGARERFAERCARLPVTVLTRCRHKGAIESAGTTLQQVVKTLTEQSDPGLRQLPHKLLMEFMHLLLKGSTAKGTSVSRRSAGMAILVHRVVLGDQQPDKPLLHECISCLFELLECNVNQPALEEAQHDLPQTQALHFLRTLVADATLRVAMSPYMCQAALYCFRHLNSPVWSIRNASLQLFGAIVPKIVGQGKSTSDAEEEDDSLVGCISFGDLLVRFNPLCNLLLEILEAVPASGSVLKNHAELIPALSLLARLSVSEVAPWSVCEFQRLKSAFLKLLSSPISVVRSLAAKAFSRFTPLMDSANAFEELTGILLKQNTENGRNGVLTAMKLIKDHLLLDGQLTQAADSEQKRIFDLIRAKLLPHCWNRTSYSSQAIVLSILEPKHNFDQVESSLQLFDQISSAEGHTHIGINQWVATHMKQIMTDCRIEVLPMVIDKSLNLSSCADVPRTALYYVIRRLDENIATSVVQEILDVCVSHVGLSQTQSNYETFHLLNAILKIIIIASNKQVALACDISNIIQISHKFSSSEFGTRCEAVSLPVMTGLIMFSSAPINNGDYLFYANRGFNNDKDEVLGRIVNILQTYSQPHNDEDYRLAAATALRFIGATLIQQICLNTELNFKCLSEMATLILDTAIRLLQDEDSHVREEASKFVIHLSEDVPKSFNSLECLEILLTYDFLSKFLGSKQEVIKFLWKFLSLKDICCFLSRDNDIENPFDHGSKNIFAEEIWVVEQAMKSIKDIVDPCHNKAIFYLVFGELSTSFKDIQENLIGHEYLSQNTTDTKVAVREEWQASALCLQQKKILYRLKILKDVFVDNKEHILSDQYLIPFTNLTLQIRNFISNFSFYL